VTGAGIFECLIECALIENGDIVSTASPTYEEVTANIPPITLNRLPEPFRDGVVDYVAGAKTKQVAEPGPASAESTAFGFYTGAMSRLRGDYVDSRIAAGDIEGIGIDALQQQLTKTDFALGVVPEGSADNVNVNADILTAIAVALCCAKNRICSSEELTDFVVDNFEITTNLSSATRELLRGKSARPALPYGYGQGILQGDERMLAGRYVKAAKDDTGKWIASWPHASLRRGNWPMPGHCPASDYNLLQPTTEQLFAVGRSLARLGIGFDPNRVIENNRFPGAKFVVARALGVASKTVFQDSTRQERLLRVENRL
jgi:hypothetical protein